MQVSSDQVIKTLRDVSPSTIYKHVVTVNGVKYPVKQAFAVITGTDVMDCDTNVARRTFQKLGFPVERVEPPELLEPAKPRATRRKGKS